MHSTRNSHLASVSFLLWYLDAKEDDVIPPDYGSLLLSIRREEAHRLRKQSASKIIRTQQVAEACGGSETALLRKQMASLHEEVFQLRQQRAQEPGQILEWEQKGSPTNGRKKR